VENEPIKIGAGVNSFFRNFLIIAKKMIFRGKRGLHAGFLGVAVKKVLGFSSRFYRNHFRSPDAVSQRGLRVKILSGLEVD
jgi:hypothetical protein